MQITDTILKDKIMRNKLISIIIKNKLLNLILMMSIWKEMMKSIRIDILENYIKIIIIPNPKVFKLIFCQSLFLPLSMVVI